MIPIELIKSPRKCHKALWIFKLSSSFRLFVKITVTTILKINPIVEIISIDLKSMSLGLKNLINPSNIK